MSIAYRRQKAVKILKKKNIRLFENEVQSKYQKYLTVNTCACSINYVSVELLLRGV